MNEATEVQLGPCAVVNPKRERIAYVWGPGVRTGGLVSPSHARELWFYSSFSMPRSMISAKLTGQPSRSVALSESERIFS
jgi:hypothetical protein